MKPNNNAETEDEIIKELANTIKFIPSAERKSVWYRTYLERVHSELLRINT